MVATVTSLPELATDVSAVLIDAPNLAAGDLFGSSLANMLILAMLSIVFFDLWKGYEISSTEWSAWILALIVTAESAFFILVDVGPRLGAVGIGSLFIVITYLVGTHLSFRNKNIQTKKPKETDTKLNDTGLTFEIPAINQTLLLFTVWAAVILITAPILAHTGASLATITGLGDTLFGVITLAILTSLPELASSFTAFRKGMPSMALGNLIGSNGINMLIIVAVDIALTDGPFLQTISQIHALGAIAAILMMIITIYGVLLLTRSHVKLGKTLLTTAILFYIMSVSLIGIQTT
jgi:cation:H+ antiporter